MFKETFSKDLRNCTASAFIIIVLGCQQNLGLIESNSRQTINADAPTETQSLGRLVGKWSVKGESLDQNGNWNSRDQYNEWHWYYILNGHAVQDDWITVVKASDGSDSTVTYGTNIRIYNSDTEEWHMAWIHQDGRTLKTFTAVNETNKIVMNGFAPNGVKQRNTFFDITGNNFEWIQEWAIGGEGAWVTVAKLHATRL